MLLWHKEAQLLCPRDEAVVKIRFENELKIPFHEDNDAEAMDLR